jgi:hypothetical protein
MVSRGSHAVNLLINLKVPDQGIALSHDHVTTDLIPTIKDPGQIAGTRQPNQPDATTVLDGGIEPILVPHEKWGVKHAPQAGKIAIATIVAYPDT